MQAFTEMVATKVKEQFYTYQYTQYSSNNILRVVL